MRKGIIRNSILVIMILGVMTNPLSWASEKNPVRPTLIAGDDYNFPPYSFLDEDGNPQGFNIDLTRAIADAMGYDVTFKLEEWSTVREDLKSGKINLVSGMFYNEARSKLYEFSTKVSITNGGIFSKDDVVIEEISELTGKTVVVVKDDIVGEQLMMMDLDIVFIEVGSIHEALIRIESGENEYAALIKISGLFELEKENIKDIILQPVFIQPQDYSMAVIKGNDDLLNVINGGLNIVKSTGQYNEIYDRWLGIYEEKSLTEIIKENRGVVGLICLILLVLLIMLGLLTRKISNKNKLLLNLCENLVVKQFKIEAANHEMDISIEELIDVQDKLENEYSKINP